MTLCELKAMRQRQPAGHTPRPKPVVPANARWVAPFLREHLAGLERALGVTLLRRDVATPGASGLDLAPALGYGKFGAAFTTTDGRVVKVTTDNAEPVMGMVIQGWQRGADGVPMDLALAACNAVVRVDGIVTFPGLVRNNGSDVPVYALVREGVTPVSRADALPESVREALDTHFDGWVAWFDWRDSRRKSNRVSTDEVMGVEVFRGWDAINDEPSGILADFCTVQRALWNLGIPHQDTHIDNFGWRGSPGPGSGAQLVLFDIGGNDPLSPRDGIEPLDGDVFAAYYPWKKMLARVPVVQRRT